MRNDDGPYLRRSHQPLKPVASIDVVSGDDIRKIPPSKITSSKVGQKAYGLASLPRDWLTPFFVVEADCHPSQRALDHCLKQFQFDALGEVMVRSSGADESILERGSNDSTSCAPEMVRQTIAALESSLPRKPRMERSRVHWVIQPKIHTAAKGHLSNERRVSKVDRDWLAEIEQTTGQSYESHPIAIRPWRDPRVPAPEVLLCPYKANYVDCLEKVARWAFARQIRIHFEWVWDGNVIYIVQADESPEDASGSDPHEVVVVPNYFRDDTELEVFRRAAVSDFQSLPKLGNTKIYQKIGYQITDFFILSSEDELRTVVEKGVVSASLARDLAALTRAPLIIRTDGSEIPEDRRTMLPRSDELRSEAAAMNWLLKKFAPEVRKLHLLDKSLSLIAHNFIPAVASAWCQAHPDKRRVRIESLWGIPEGLYWYAHDTFDVDTLEQSISMQRSKRPFNIHKRLRYKSQFIAPDIDGRWVLHKTKAGADWNPSIQKTQWIEEIAWSSRLIALEAGHPVVVMWFIGVPKAAHTHEIIPWYHEKWYGAGPVVKAAPQRKTPLDKDYRISTSEDWDQLRSVCDSRNGHVSRVRVVPEDPDLVRGQSFAKELGTYAKKYGFVIELAGGILSHAYYLLKNAGCAVECSDLFAVNDEQLEFNKLVRDKIPDLILTHGESVEVVRLVGEALVESLKRKVVEEAFEVLKARNTNELQEEIADLLQVIEALKEKLGIDQESIELARKKKEDNRGGFGAGLMLRSTSLESAVTMSNEIENLELALPPGEVAGEISRIHDLPGERVEANKDTRHDGLGHRERQITLTLPVFGAQGRRLELGVLEDEKEVYTMESYIDIVGTNVRIKLRFLPEPKQVEMEI